MSTVLEDGEAGRLDGEAVLFSAFPPAISGLKYLKQGQTVRWGIKLLKRKQTTETLADWKIEHNNSLIYEDDIKG